MENSSSENGRAYTPPLNKDMPQKRPGDHQGYPSMAPPAVSKKRAVGDTNGHAKGDVGAGGTAEATDGGSPPLAFHEQYACFVKKLQEDLTAIFEEQYCELFQLLQEEDAVFERVGQLVNEAQAANADVEQQVSQAVQKMKDALDRIQQNMA